MFYFKIGSIYLGICLMLQVVYVYCYCYRQYMSIVIVQYLSRYMSIVIVIGSIYLGKCLLLLLQVVSTQVYVYCYCYRQYLLRYMSIVTGSIYLGICLLLLSNIAEANILVLVLVADWLHSTLNGGQSIGNLGITFISANC